MLENIIPEFKPVRKKEEAMQNFKDVAESPTVYPMRVMNQICRYVCPCEFNGDRAHCRNSYCFWGIMKKKMFEIHKNNMKS